MPSASAQDVLYTPISSVWEGSDAELLEEMFRFYPSIPVEPICDLIIKIRSGPMVSDRWKTAHHARKRHCFWIICRTGSYAATVTIVNGLPVDDSREYNPLGTEELGSRPSSRNLATGSISAGNYYNFINFTSGMM